MSDNVKDSVHGAMLVDASVIASFFSIAALIGGSGVYKDFEDHCRQRLENQGFVPVLLWELTFLARDHSIQIPEESSQIKT